MSLPLPAPECSIYYPELDNSPGIIINPKRKSKNGFTLIELSIVLVIIGLLAGGLLVGRDLIKAAEVRATATQVEKYNQAVNTFRGKYGYLPGDVPDPVASSFGFKARGLYAGEGDGNAVLEGVRSDAAGQNGGLYMTAGEVLMFWEDLSAANLIEGSFTLATPTVPIYASQGTTTIPLYMPAAKIGGGNYINVWSGGYRGSTTPATDPSDQMNYFQLSVITGFSCGWCLSTAPGLTVSQAYMIDAKIDDGLPQSGRVQAMYVNSSVEPLNTAWAAGAGNKGAYSQIDSGYRGPTTAATPASSTTCYDNNNVVGAEKYSVTTNSGSGVNCALSIRFQ